MSTNHKSKGLKGRDLISIGIYSAITGKTAEQVAAEFENKGYGDFKTAVGEAVVEELRPVRERFDTFIADKKQLIYKINADAARYFYSNLAGDNMPLSYLQAVGAIHESPACKNSGLISLRNYNKKSGAPDFLCSIRIYNN